MTTAMLEAVAAYVTNLDAYLAALQSGSPPPVLKFRSGYRLASRPVDTLPYLVYEICVRRCYGVPSEFYVPRADDTVLDIGAHIGLFTVSLLAVCRSIRVHCFEPCEDVRPCLDWNIRENGMEQYVAVHGVAISDVRGEKTLHVGAETGHSSLYARRRPAVADVPVRCITLTDAVKRTSADRIALLKIDTEGSEFDILRSGDQETWERIDRVALEFHDDIIPGIRAHCAKFFRNEGFEICAIDTRPPFNERTGIMQAAKTHLLSRVVKGHSRQQEGSR